MIIQWKVPYPWIDNLHNLDYAALFIHLHKSHLLFTSLLYTPIQITFYTLEQNILGLIIASYSVKITKINLCRRVLRWAWTDSPPCSPWNRRPKCHCRIQGMTWSSSRCIFGGTVSDGNEAQKLMSWLNASIAGYRSSRNDEVLYPPWQAPNRLNDLAYFAAIALASDTMEGQISPFIDHGFCLATFVYMISDKTLPIVYLALHLEFLECDVELLSKRTLTWFQCCLFGKCLFFRQLKID